jgi:hypothetical protein
VQAVAPHDGRRLRVEAHLAPVGERHAHDALAHLAGLAGLDHGAGLAPPHTRATADVEREGDDAQRGERAAGATEHGVSLVSVRRGRAGATMR